jgi:aminoglycoside 6'-N-acetyltransferase I
MTQPTFKVRTVEEKDFDDWLRLRKLLWDETSEEEHRAEMLEIFEDSESQLVLIAEIPGERYVGFLEASIRPFVEDCYSEEVGYLEGWFVEPEFRRKGVGRMLVGDAENWARSKGCEEMASDSEVGNDLSLEAHSSLGYEVTARLIHFRKELV